MAGLALLCLAAIALLPAAHESPLGRWVLSETLTPARVLPLIGLGAVFGLAGARVFGAALVLFSLGILAGFVAQDRLLRILDVVPQAATHLFLTGPISYLAAGAALAAGTSLRRWLTPVAALIVGAMLALVIKMTDPSLHEPAYTWTPLLIAYWTVIAVALTLRAFWRGWFPIFGRILGSWLLAIGLLYGGAALMPKREPPPALPMPASPESTPPPAFDQTIPGLPSPDPSAPGPNPGGDRLPQL